MEMIDIPDAPPKALFNVKPLSRSSSLLSALPRLAIPRTPRTRPTTSSPLSAPPTSAPPLITPLTAEPPAAPPPSAASPCRNTPILSRILPLSPLPPLPSPTPTKFLQARRLGSERFTVEYLIARFPLAVRVWASTDLGIIAARIEFESVDVAEKVLLQHGGNEAWMMGSYELMMEFETEGNRWWEWEERRACMIVRNGKAAVKEVGEYLPEGNIVRVS